MKLRRLTVWVLAVLMICSLSLTVFAASGNNAKIDYVTDTAGLLSDSEKAALENKAAAVSQKYNLGVYIIVVDDFRSYSNKSNVWDCAMELYNKYDLGWDQDRAGAILMLSMAKRDFALDFNSDRANYAFTEKGRDLMEEDILSYFGNDDFYGGFDCYLEDCRSYLEAAANGSPVGEGERSSADGGGLGIFSAIPGAIVAFVTGTVMSSSMRSAGLNRTADAYLVKGSMRLTGQSDMFLHRTVTRTPKKSSSGSGGSTHHSSGGHSGRSGKF